MMLENGDDPDYVQELEDDLAERLIQAEKDERCQA